MRLPGLRAASFLVCVSLAQNAMAAGCVDLWLERNTIFKSHGYCFGSELGQGYFGNAGCHTKAPQVSEQERRRVADIIQREKQMGCAEQKKHWTVALLKSYALIGPAPAPEKSAQATRPAPATVPAVDPQQSPLQRKVQKTLAETANSNFARRFGTASAQTGPAQPDIRAKGPEFARVLFRHQGRRPV